MHEVFIHSLAALCAQSKLLRSALCTDPHTPVYTKVPPDRVHK